MTTTIRQILCPVDLSDNSKTALEYARGLARRFGANIVVLHVDPVVVSAMGDLPPGPDAVTRDRLYERLEHFVEPMRRSRALVAVELEEGGVVGEILARAEELPADLIVMGTHGRGGFERFALGSVTDKVVRKAVCPVLCVPRGARLCTGPRGGELGRSGGAGEVVSLVGTLVA